MGAAHRICIENNCNAYYIIISWDRIIKVSKLFRVFFLLKVAPGLLALKSIHENQQTCKMWTKNDSIRIIIELIKAKRKEFSSPSHGLRASVIRITAL